MNEGLDQGKIAFREEANELLTELETSLLELEENPEDAELIARVFRAMHTIKGSGAMFGFDDIASFTHEVETAFDLVRNGKLPVTKQIIDLTLASRDQIRGMLEESAGGSGVDKAKSEEIVNAFKSIIASSEGGKDKEKDDGHKETASKKDKPAAQNKEAEGPNNTTYRIRFKPGKDLFVTGTNPLLLLGELKELGHCAVIAQTKEIPELEDLNTENCYTFWDIILTTDKGENSIKDVFIFVEDSCDIKIQIIDEESEFDAEEEYKKIGDILIERGDATLEDLQKALGGRKKVGELLVESGLVDQGQVKAALEEQKAVRTMREQRTKATASSESTPSVRVPSDKLDSLVDLVGELVTVQARLSQISAIHLDANLTTISEEVERLTWELRDSTMSIRMMPIGSTFSKFKRLVRDLSSELGKEVAMTTDGAETELDKTVIEKLNDPLVHIIRNSIDHGIEAPDVRKKAGKPAEGTVHLSAAHSGANVLIRIDDDGAGLNKEAILNKAVSSGLITPDAELSEKEIYGLIFQPGFSTAKKISSVSGRGVGMDVVKRNIDALRGSIEVQSKQGAGSSIILKLPLTLAIIDGLLVKIGSEVFVIHLSVVEECFELTKTDIDKTHGRHVANVRNEIVPYIRLREFFMLEGDKPEIEQIVIVDIDDQRIGFVVDYVIGEHQTVIKSLGKVYKGIEGISGATILGDGTVALILDVQTLVKFVEKEEIASR
ncbi:chemotaxis protein histidine kinase-like protein [Candidatus Magnetoovum chiemensis]|nr:chemotaxis protein histidine kinase-like protein [Candidatus Magnetoovum chiemensis]